MIPDVVDAAPYGLSALAGLGVEHTALRARPQTEAEAQRRADRQVAENLLWRRHFEQQDPCAREALILLLLPYAKAVAGSLYRQHVHHDTEFREYVQWATLGLIEAFDRYDPARGAQFRTYAHARMLGAMRSGLAHSSERQEQITLHRSLLAERIAATHRGSALTDATASQDQLLRDMAELSASVMLSFMLEDTAMVQPEDGVLPDRSYDSVTYREEQQRVRGLIDQLTPREQSVVRLHYLQGLRFNDIAESLGITKGRVSQLHEQALVRLRKLLGP